MAAMAAAIKAAHLGTGEDGGPNIMLPMSVDEDDIAERHPAALVGTFKPFKN